MLHRWSGISWHLRSFWIRDAWRANIDPGCLGRGGKNTHVVFVCGELLLVFKISTKKNNFQQTVCVGGCPGTSTAIIRLCSDAEVNMIVLQLFCFCIGKETWGHVLSISHQSSLTKTTIWRKKSAPALTWHMLTIWWQLAKKNRKVTQHHSVCIRAFKSI